MELKIVIGLGFGDEGKGLVTDYLCTKTKNPLVMRFSGGHQAGHTVNVKGVSHVFSNFGSGGLRGRSTYWSKYCTVHPTGILNEMRALHNKSFFPKLYIDAKCPITTPYEIYHDQFDSITFKHGSCGVGFGKTIEREEKFVSLLFEDLYNETVFNIKMQMIHEYYYNNINTVMINELNIDEFKEDCKELIHNEYIGKVDRVYDLFFNYKTLVAEGSQGLLLDKDIGFFPHVTRSNTDCTNLNDFITNEVHRFNANIYYVTRAYQTRHGNGPMTNEDIPHNIKLDENETNKTNQYQGDFRRSILDLDLLEYSLNKSKSTFNYTESIKRTLVITCLDHVIGELKYTYKGKLVKHENPKEFINSIKTILGFKKVLASISSDSYFIEEI